ncbi:hypothetical protein QBC36DRAFT_309647 [Triangularia setosa]|uniref:Uncharacterized protein n=1 Tax=Triangularia setosa TaxID=2587417 RepID=A0AAN6WAD7_9PEZI|nr:hypothetical protein QBC36DRAFT_309647 [Podospora setosa]
MASFPRQKDVEKFYLSIPHAHLAFLPSSQHHRGCPHRAGTSLAVYSTILAARGKIMAAKSLRKEPITFEAPLVLERTSGKLPALLYRSSATSSHPISCRAPRRRSERNACPLSCRRSIVPLWDIPGKPNRLRLDGKAFKILFVAVDTIRKTMRYVVFILGPNLAPVTNLSIPGQSCAAPEVKERALNLFEIEEREMPTYPGHGKWINDLWDLQKEGNRRADWSKAAGKLLWSGSCSVECIKMGFRDPGNSDASVVFAFREKAYGNFSRPMYTSNSPTSISDISSTKHALLFSPRTTAALLSLTNSLSLASLALPFSNTTPLPCTHDLPRPLDNPRNDHVGDSLEGVLGLAGEGPGKRGLGGLGEAGVPLQEAFESHPLGVEGAAVGDEWWWRLSKMSM